jgi:hypothetical protein
MKANKTHISLETAKLLIDCGVESEYIFFTQNKKSFISNKKKNHRDGYPAFAWGEILWEYPDKFFGVGEKTKNYFDGKEHEFLGGKLSYSYDEGGAIEFTTKESRYVALQIFSRLMQGKYEQADKYFRRNCILIKKQNDK